MRSAMPKPSRTSPTPSHDSPPVSEVPSDPPDGWPGVLRPLPAMVVLGEPTTVVEVVVSTGIVEDVVEVVIAGAAVSSSLRLPG